MELRQSTIFLCVYYFLDSVFGQSYYPVLQNEQRRQRSPVVMPRSFSPNSVREAFRNAEEIVNQRRSRVSIARKPLDPNRDAAVIRHNTLQRSKYRPIQSEGLQEKFEEATKLLWTEFNLNSEQIMFGLPETNLQNVLPDNTLQQCQALFKVNMCHRNDRYRTFDGSCNNLDHPKWGMAETCFDWLFDPVYSDGMSGFRLSISGRPLPTPRTISLEIYGHLDNPAENITHMFMQWGQFMNHDISLTAPTRDSNNQILNCCPDEKDNPKQCAPILLEKDDPFFSEYGIDCLSSARNKICSTCTLGPRKQIDEVTAFIDASQVYGTSLNESRSLRTLDGSGTMRTFRDSDAGELLPQSYDPANDSCSYQDPVLNCFQAGDPRVNQHPALTSFHTIFVREHNRIARSLRVLNRNWDDERIFQETRRIVGAEMQVITYNEFLPITIGPERMEEFDLNVQKRAYTWYDPTVEPMLLSEFSSSAFRFAHSVVNSFFPEISKSFVSGNTLRNLFFYPFGLYSGQLDRITKGLAVSPSQKNDRYIVPDVTNHLYQKRGNPTGIDLVSLNVMRGRDHGVPPYIDVVRFCGGPRITSFRDLDQLLQKNTWQIFQRVYEFVEDIDLYSGGQAERPNPGAVVGPTFMCIIETQFYRLKYGDRFYFEHGGQTGSFTPQQLAELRKITFAKIICDNTLIDELQTNVMINPDSNKNPIRQCREIPGIDLTVWRE